MSDRTETATKEDVAARVADEMDCSQYQARKFVRAVLTALGDLMIEADPERRIELRNFGVFEVKKTKAQPSARNPQTNETVFVPSRRKTHFKAGKRIREVLKTPLRDLGYSVPEGSADAPTQDGESG